MYRYLSHSRETWRWGGKRVKKRFSWYLTYLITTINNSKPCLIEQTIELLSIFINNSLFLSLFLYLFLLYIFMHSIYSILFSSHRFLIMWEMNMIKKMPAVKSQMTRTLTMPSTWINSKFFSVCVHLKSKSIYIKSTSIVAWCSCSIWDHQIDEIHYNQSERSRHKARKIEIKIKIDWKLSCLYEDDNDDCTYSQLFSLKFYARTNSFFYYYYNN